jgi:hypothetical protein
MTSAAPATTLARIIVADDDLGDWLRDCKNRRAIPHRLERCGYLGTYGDAEDGLWVLAGKRQVIYARTDFRPRPDQGSSRAVGAGVNEWGKGGPTGIGDVSGFTSIICPYACARPSLSVNGFWIVLV